MTNLLCLDLSVSQEPPHRERNAATGSMEKRRGEPVVLMSVWPFRLAGCFAYWQCGWQVGSQAGQLWLNVFLWIFFLIFFFFPLGSLLTAKE